MKKDINQVLKSIFERDFNNAKKSADAERKQKPFSKVYYTNLSNGLSFVREFANN